jgi:hypothetical protein
VKSNNYQCYCLTETKLDMSLSDSVFGLADFSIFRSDRTRRSGGVAIFVNKNVRCNPVSIVLDRNVPYDITTIDLFSVDGLKCRVLCVYRPPHCNLADSNHLFSVIGNLINRCETFVICGDFNFPGMGWNPPMSNGAISGSFLELVEEYGMTQCVLCPTHRDGNVLDLVLGSDELLVSDLTVDPPLFMDHFSVSFSLNFNIGGLTRYRTLKQYGKCDDLSAFLLHIDWNTIFNTCQNTVDFWREFKNVVLFGIDTQIPSKKVRTGGNGKLLFT